METKTILKYRRECDAWICTECDSENMTNFRRCAVCGSVRNEKNIIVKAGTPADENRKKPNYDEEINDNSELLNEDGEFFYDAHEEKSENTGTVMLWFLVGLLAIFIVFLLLQNA